MRPDATMAEWTRGCVVWAGLAASMLALVCAPPRLPLAGPAIDIAHEAELVVESDARAREIRSNACDSSSSRDP